MTDSISRRDWDRLSAYVDGQLSAKESARFGARLKQEPALQAALDDLKTIRGALRSLPQLRAPRNFTLTPQMAGVRHVAAARLYPTFRLASVISSLLFIVVLVGNIFSPGQMTMAPAAQKAAVSPEIMDEAPAAPAEDMASAENTGETLAEPAAEAALLATDTLESEPAEEESAPMLTLTPTAASAPSPAAPESPTMDSEIPRTSANTISGLAILEIVLAALALTTGLAALFLHWRSQR